MPVSGNPHTQQQLSLAHPWQSIAGLRKARESTSNWTPVYWQMLTDLATKILQKQGCVQIKHVFKQLYCLRFFSTWRILFSESNDIKHKHEIFSYESNIYENTPCPCHITAGGSRFFFIILETVHRIFKMTSAK